MTFEEALALLPLNPAATEQDRVSAAREMLMREDAVVINDNQPGKTAIVEMTGGLTTIPVGTRLRVLSPLVAAAPEMLEALKAQEALYSGAFLTMTEAEIAKISEMRRAAIAKAEGRTAFDRAIASAESSS